MNKKNLKICLCWDPSLLASYLKIPKCLIKKDFSLLILVVLVKRNIMFTSFFSSVYKEIMMQAGPYQQKSKI